MTSDCYSRWSTELGRNLGVFTMTPLSHRLLLCVGVALALAVFPVRADEQLGTAGITIKSGSSLTELPDDYDDPDGDSSSSITIDTGNIRLNSTRANSPSSRHRTREPRNSSTRNRTIYNCTTQSSGSVTQTSCSSVDSSQNPSQVTRQQSRTTCGNSSVRQTTRITGNNKTVNQNSVSTSSECK